MESRGFVLGGAVATTLGAGFVAVRKAAGHFPVGAATIVEETSPHMLRA